MDAIPGITVGECVGWKISSDKQTVLLGFRDTKGNPFNLAIGEDTLKDAVFALLRCQRDISQGEDATERRSGRDAGARRLILSRPKP